MSPAPSKTWGSQALSELSGVTLRQLQWWSENGLLLPQVTSHRREYDERQAVAALILARLRKAGIALQRCRRIVKSSIADDISYMAVSPSGRVRTFGYASTLIPFMASAGFHVVVDVDAIREKIRIG